MKLEGVGDDAANLDGNVDERALVLAGGGRVVGDDPLVELVFVGSGEVV